MLGIHLKYFRCLEYNFHFCILVQGQKKSKKKRTKKNVKDKNDDDTRSNITHDTGQGQGGGEGQLNVNSAITKKSDDEFHPAWSKISSSESEWSDTEGGQMSRLRSYCTKVRQCALSCYYWIVKVSSHMQDRHGQEKTLEK